MKNILYILLFFLSFNYAQNKSIFDNANSLYNNENYNDAILEYQRILSSGEHSAAVYFNLGNAYYKLNQIGQSIYYYEKALQLEPENDDVLTNLAFAKNMRIDKIDVIPTTGFSKIFSSLVNTMSFDTWALFSVILMFLFITAFVLYTQSKFTNRKRYFFITAMFCLFFSILTLAFAYKQEAELMKKKYAIVFAEESQVKTEPKLNSNEAFELHEGTKVKVLDVFEDWTKIRLTNGSTGWIISNDIKQL